MSVSQYSNNNVLYLYSKFTHQNPHIYILNPHIYILNPHNCILNPHNCILNPHNCILNPRICILNSRICMLNPHTSILNPHNKIHTFAFQIHTIKPTHQRNNSFMNLPTRHEQNTEPHRARLLGRLAGIARGLCLQFLYWKHEQIIFSFLETYPVYTEKTIFPFAFKLDWI